MKSTFLLDAKDEQSVLVALERGAAWPDECVRRVRRSTPNAVIEKQVADESALTFAQRVLSRFRRGLHRGNGAKVAILAFCDRFDPEINRAREELARELASELNRFESGELLLSSSPSSQPDSHTQLFDLLERVLRQVRPRNLRLGLVFPENQQPVPSLVRATGLVHAV